MYPQKNENGISFRRKTIDEIVAEAIEKLTENEKAIVESLRRYNQLRKVPLSALDILEWKESIMEVNPDTDPKAVNFVITRMIAGEIDCDGGGIQNIMNGLKSVSLRGNQYHISRPFIQ